MQFYTKEVSKIQKRQSVSPNDGIEDLRTATETRSVHGKMITGKETRDGFV